MKHQSESPFRSLGRELKALRSKHKESLADVSESVEIDVQQLASYEMGQDRPNEEILLLLISHFGVKDDLAIKLWELAGYGAKMVAEPASPQSAPDNTAPRILFTDTVDVMVNNYGVVMNFMQNGGRGNPVPIARVGMSREHAKSVLKILEVTLSQTENNIPLADKPSISDDLNSN